MLYDLEEVRDFFMLSLYHLQKEIFMGQLLGASQVLGAGDMKMIKSWTVQQVDADACL